MEQQRQGWQAIQNSFPSTLKGTGELGHEATESFVYGVPGIKLGGRPLVCYAGFKKHCGFYPMNPAVPEDERRRELSTVWIKRR